MDSKSTFKDNFLSIHEEAMNLARQSKYANPKNLLVLGVSKTVDIDDVADVYCDKARCFAENRPQELQRKANALPYVSWHFIGNIQSRCIPIIVQYSSLIHSLCSINHLEKIDRAAKSFNKVQEVLIEVNISGEESKSGCSPHQIMNFFDESKELDNIRIVGLMTMAPKDSQDVAWQCFDELRILRDNVRDRLYGVGDARADDMRELSMGMTDDWRVAILAGATIIRVGRAIFSSGQDG